jgi:hypothetical protein
MSGEPGDYLSAFLCDASHPRGLAVRELLGDRIYPERLPQQHPSEPAVIPAAVFQLSGADRQAMFCATDGTIGAQYQIDIYAAEFDQIAPIARAIRRRLRDYSGPMGEARVSKVLLDNEFAVGPDPEPGLFRRTQLYTVWHWED